MTDQQRVTVVVLMIVVAATAAFIAWEIAVGRYRSRARKRDAAIKDLQKKYVEMLRKLDEDPQAYAMGLGISYVIRTLRATLDAIEADLEKPA